MNTARDQIREDMDKQPEQLQREADDVRVDMEQTVDELANQFSPGELINSAMGMVRGGGDNQFVRNLSTQIQNNPVPAILAGVSLTWLMTASKQPPVQGSRAGGSNTIKSAGSKLSSAADRARSSSQNMSQSASEKRQHVAETAREKQQRVAESASDIKHRLSDSSHQMMDSARTGVRSVRNRYDTMLQEQPLMLGAMAIAAGAALGALMPRTEAEDRTMGDVSDEQKQTVKQRAEQMKEQAESKVEEKLDEQRSQSGSSQRGPDSSTQSASSGSGTASSVSSSSSSATSGTEGQRRDASSPSAHSQGEASTTSSPAAGASGPPGSAPSAGKTDEGVPAANPSSVPNHPDTNPPTLNRREDGKR